MIRTLKKSVDIASSEQPPTYLILNSKTLNVEHQGHFVTAGLVETASHCLSTTEEYFIFPIFIPGSNEIEASGIEICRTVLFGDESSSQRLMSLRYDAGSDEWGCFQSALDVREDLAGVSMKLSTPPTFSPTSNPTVFPTLAPSRQGDTTSPSIRPTKNPSVQPSRPSFLPSAVPTLFPSRVGDTTAPSCVPTTPPSIAPTKSIPQLTQVTCSYQQVCFTLKQYKCCFFPWHF